MWVPNNDSSPPPEERSFSKYLKWEQLDFVINTLASLEKDMKLSTESHNDRFRMLQEKLSATAEKIHSISQTFERRILEPRDYKTLKSELRSVDRDLCFAKAHLEQSSHLMTQTMESIKTQIPDLIYHMGQIEMNFKNEVVKLETPMAEEIELEINNEPFVFQSQRKSQEDSSSNTSNIQSANKSAIKEIANDDVNVHIKDVGVNTTEAKETANDDVNVRIKEVDMSTTDSSCSGVVSVEFQNVPLKKRGGSESVTDVDINASEHHVKADDDVDNRKQSTSTRLLEKASKWEKLEFAEKILRADTDELRYTVLFFENSFEDLGNKIYNVKHMIWPIDRHRKLYASDYTVLWRKMVYAARMLTFIVKYIEQAEVPWNELYNSFPVRISVINGIIQSVASVFEQEELEIIGLASGSSEPETDVTAADQAPDASISSSHAAVTKHGPCSETTENNISFKMDPPSESSQPGNLSFEPHVSINVCENLCSHSKSGRSHHEWTHDKSKDGNVENEISEKRLDKSFCSADSAYCRWCMSGELEYGGPKQGYDFNMHSRFQHMRIPENQETSTATKFSRSSSPPQSDSSRKRFQGTQTDKQDSDVFKASNQINGSQVPRHSSERSSSSSNISEGRISKSFHISGEERIAHDVSGTCSHGSVQESSPSQTPKQFPPRTSSFPTERKNTPPPNAFEESLAHAHRAPSEKGSISPHESLHSNQKGLQKNVSVPEVNNPKSSALSGELLAPACVANPEMRNSCSHGSLKENIRSSSPVSSAEMNASRTSSPPQLRPEKLKENSSGKPLTDVPTSESYLSDFVGLEPSKGSSLLGSTNFAGQ